MPGTRPRSRKVAIASPDFDQLCAEVWACRTCARMEGSTRVLSRASGSLDAIAMFIGEAPGRLGADGTAIPFHGDKAGHNFEEFLTHANIRRNEIFVTNAVLCNPKDRAGNNATPQHGEIRACSTYLRRQIDIISPRIVVSLGAAPLYALSLIEPHQLALSSHVRTMHRWYGRLLIPLYHPGQRAIMHRSFANQLADYQFISEILRRDGRKRAIRSGSLSANVYAIIDLLTKSVIQVSYFSLHKMFYLLEYESCRRFGQRLTESYIIRQKDGPYCTELHIHRLRKAFPDLAIRTVNDRLFLRRTGVDLFSNQEASTELPKEIRTLVMDVIQKYGDKSESDLKRIVYLTSPMRSLLRLERAKHINTFNAPIDFSNLTRLSSI